MPVSLLAPWDVHILGGSSEPGELNGSQNIFPHVGCTLQVLTIGIFPESPPAGVFFVFIDNVDNLGKMCLN